MFTIDQAGLATKGKLGVSRSDGLRTGGQVTLNYPGIGTATFSLLWVPDDDTTAVASFVQVNNTATFTPDVASIGGTYRIKLAVQNGGVTTECIRLFAIRMTNTRLRIPALNELANPDASLVNNGAELIDDSEFNEPSDGRFKRGNYGGWYSAFVELVRKVEELAGG